MERSNGHPFLRDEGFTLIHRDAVYGLARVIESKGAKSVCVYGFGSRSREEGRSISDVDLLTIVDLKDAPRNLDRIMTDVRWRGAASIIVPTDEAIYHVIMVDITHLRANLRFTPKWLIGENTIVGMIKYKNMLATAEVMYGDEPLIGKKPLLQYLKRD